MDPKETKAPIQTEGFTFEENPGFEKILIPEGIYDAQFIGYKIRTKQYDDGPGKQIIWNFNVIGKSGKTVELAAFTSAKFGINPKTGEPATARCFTAVLQGKNGKDENLDKSLDNQIGKLCKVSVETYNGGSNVKGVFKPDAPANTDEIPF